MNISDIYFEKFQNYEDVKNYYSKLFIDIQSSQQIDDINIFNRGGRSYVQKPLSRLKFEIHKLFEKF